MLVVVPEKPDKLVSEPVGLFPGVIPSWRSKDDIRVNLLLKYSSVPNLYRELEEELAFSLLLVEEVKQQNLELLSWSR